MPIGKKNIGIGIIFFFSVIGFIIALLNFFLPSSPVNYTGGAELVIFSSLAIAILSLLFYFFQRSFSKRWKRAIFEILILALLLGTLLAAWFLERWIFLSVMLVALVGWFILVFSKQVNYE